MTKLITPIQLKAARNILNLSIDEIATLLKLSKSTISKAELNKTRDFLYKHSAALIDFFCTNSIIFPTEYSIRFNYSVLNQSDNYNTLTRFQLRGARYILGIDQRTLANSLNIDRNIIMRMEYLPNNNYLKSPNSSIILKIKEYFSLSGIEFPDPFYLYFKKYVDTGSKRC